MCVVCLCTTVNENIIQFIVSLSLTRTLTFNSSSRTQRGGAHMRACALIGRLGLWAGLVDHMLASVSLCATAAADTHERSPAYKHATLQLKSPFYGRGGVSLYFALCSAEFTVRLWSFGAVLSSLISWGNLGFTRREWERCARALTGLSLWGANRWV